MIASTLAFCACSDKNKDNSAKTAASETPKVQETTPVPKPAKVERTVIDTKSIDTSSADIEKALTTANSGKTANAITELKRIVDKNPKAFLGFFNLGILYERQSELANARSAYVQALEAEPKYTPALLHLVRLDIRNGNPASAVNTANRYIANHPNVFEHHYARLEAMIAAGQYDDSIALIRTLLAADEANPKLRYYLAMTEFERKRYRLAEFIVGEALEITPDDYDALFLKARIHDALSEDDVALIPGIASTLDRVLELYPDHLEALWMRANIYYEASNYTKAEELYRHILALNPRTVGAYINLANTLKTVDKGPEAETLLNKAKSLDPYNGLVDFALGTLYLNIELIHLPMKDMDRLKLARTQFENAQNNWNGTDDANLAKGYIKTTDDAIENLQAFLDAEALFGPSTPAEE